jgi:outer membrane receptor protein involved in Fe transport
MLKAVSIFGNYTLLRYDNYENFRRPHHLANGGVSFDHRGLSLRWNVTWAPTYRRNAVTPATGYGLSWAEHVSHDAQLAYRVSRRVSLFVNGRNVFNRQRRSLFTSGEDTILQNFADNGTVWTFGVRGQF